VAPRGCTPSTGPWALQTTQRQQNQPTSAPWTTAVLTTATAVNQSTALIPAAQRMTPQAVQSAVHTVMVTQAGGSAARQRQQFPALSWEESPQPAELMAVVCMCILTVYPPAHNTVSLHLPLSRIWSKGGSLPCSKSEIMGVSPFLLTATPTLLRLPHHQHSFQSLACGTSSPVATPTDLNTLSLHPPSSCIWSKGGSLPCSKCETMGVSLFLLTAVALLPHHQHLFQLFGHGPFSPVTTLTGLFFSMPFPSPIVCCPGTRHNVAVPLVCHPGAWDAKCIADIFHALHFVHQCHPGSVAHSSICKVPVICSSSTTPARLS
jgi:hypothetical protein